MSGALLADGTVARLMRWLRLDGLDVEPAEGSDSEILHRARLSGRIVLTRCVRLFHRDPERVLLITSDDPEEQVRDVLARIAPGEPLTRCSVCNSPLEPLAREDAAPFVPPYVHAHHDAFAHCPRCGRVYWEGTHVEKIRHFLASPGRERPGEASHRTAHPRPGGSLG